MCVAIFTEPEAGIRMHAFAFGSKPPHADQIPTGGRGFHPTLVGRVQLPRDFSYKNTKGKKIDLFLYSQWLLIPSNPLSVGLPPHP